MTGAFGSITWWGFSPAIDLQDEDSITALKQLNLNAESSRDKLNILLIGAGDLRHVMMTIAKCYRHRKKNIHFYILENSLELYARDILFLTIALESQTRMGLQEKTELFLELYGNILVRKQSEEYVVKMAPEFIKMVTDSDHLARKLPIVDLSQLKFKEKDAMEAIFKFWRNTDVKKGVFDVSNYWDLRQRQYLGVRYDTRTNVYDWDYNMRLAQRKADIINTHEYKLWRNTGVAFEIREGDYDVPNKTLASGMILTHEGERHARRGYWGDILVSPYIPLGIESEEKSFFQKTNKIYTKTSCHVAEYNVLSMFHEIATREPYHLPQVIEEPEVTEEETGPKITEITEKDETETGNEKMKSEEEKKKELIDTFNEESNGFEAAESHETFTEDYVPLPLEDVQITFLPIGSLNDLGKKSKYKQLFQIAYFSNSMVHLLKPAINPMLDDQATVIIESARYMLELKQEQVKLFAEKVEGIAREAGCTSADKCENDNFIKMSYERPKPS